MSRAATARREDARDFGAPARSLPRGYLKRSELPLASLVPLTNFLPAMARIPR